MTVFQSNNRRIAKNTLMLYFRTMLMMCITLYTSRVVLSTLGIEDFGLYNVVGGVVIMFQMLSSSLSTAISRFITYELGKNYQTDESSIEADQRLNTIFTTAVNIQILIGFVLVVVTEVLGVWILENYLNIPSGRMDAANWVLQCSIITFFINLISVPYNATIIAHERMSAYACISILEAVLKLLIVYMLYVSPWDKLKSYAVLLLVVSIIVRFIYSAYCSRNFVEARYRFVLDRKQFRQMISFASWNFLGSVCGTLNTQGVNMLMNIYFGVTMNAARGIAVQVETAVSTFASNFTMALNPQITKNYASGNVWEMIKLVERGTKYSFFIMYLFVVPITIETEMLLKIWLGEIPDHTVIFVRFSIFATLINMMANSVITAIQATGNIKRYVLEVNFVSAFVFPLTLLAYYYGLNVCMAYVILIFIRLCLHIIRLLNMRKLVDFSMRNFICEVWGRSIVVAVTSFVIPILLYMNMVQNVMSFFIIVAVSLLSTSLCIWVFGMNRQERNFISEQITRKVNTKLKYDR